MRIIGMQHRRERRFKEPNSRAEMRAKVELRMVSNVSDFEEWVRRWSESLPTVTLQYLTSPSAVPPNHAQRISQIVKEYEAEPH